MSTLLALDCLALVNKIHYYCGVPSFYPGVFFDHRGIVLSHLVRISLVKSFNNTPALISLFALYLFA